MQSIVICSGKAAAASKRARIATPFTNRAIIQTSTRSLILAKCILNDFINEYNRNDKNLNGILISSFYKNLSTLFSNGHTNRNKTSSNLVETISLSNRVTQQANGCNSTTANKSPNSIICNFFKSLFTQSIPSVIQKQTCEKKLHLITAFSGYSIKKQPIQINKSVIGDDAWFIAKQKCVDVLGVADGVGGWHDFGIDPSKFSSNLMKTCKRIVEQELFDTSKPIDNKTPKNLLNQSYESLIENKNSLMYAGSSTACIVVFHHDTKLLHTANLGDSGFVIIRNNKIIHRSQEQQHYFNSPYQMAILPISAYDLISDSPQSALTSSIELNEGDLIVLATDGLWDNLSDKQLLVETSRVNLVDDLDKAAENIARKAVELANDPDYLSPFALSARHNGINISGGKPDDITVLLARVSS